MPIGETAYIGRRLRANKMLGSSFRALTNWSASGAATFAAVSHRLSSSITSDTR